MMLMTVVPGVKSEAQAEEGHMPWLEVGSETLSASTSPRAYVCGALPPTPSENSRIFCAYFDYWLGGS